MKLLTIVMDLGPGGTQRVAENYTHAYREAGFETAVLTYAGAGPRAETLRAAGTTLFVSDSPHDARRQIAAARAWGADVMHIHRPGSAEATTAKVLALLREGDGGKPRVMETNVFSRVDYSPNRTLIDLHLHLTHWCLWKWQQRTRGYPGIAPGITLPYAVNTHAFFPEPPSARDAFRARHGIPPDAFLAGRIGQPITWKWHLNILSAFHTFAERQANAWLLLVGFPREWQSHIDALPESVRKRIVQVSFLHGDAALREAYAALDVFLHASLIGESFGMVLAESLLCHCPVITFATPHKDNSQVEVVPHGEAGWVALSEAGLVAALEEARSDPQEARQRGMRGAERVKRLYSMTTIKPLLVALAERVYAAPDLDTLRASLRTLPGDSHRVDASEIQHRMTAGLGSLPASIRLKTWAAHHPALYKRWSHYKLDRLHSEIP